MLQLRSWGNENLKRLKKNFMAENLMVCQPWRPRGKKIRWETLSNWCIQCAGTKNWCIQLLTSVPGTKKDAQSHMQRAVGINWFSRIRKLA